MSTSALRGSLAITSRLAVHSLSLVLFPLQQFERVLDILNVRVLVVVATSQCHVSR